MVTWVAEVRTYLAPSAPSSKRFPNESANLLHGIELQSGYEPGCAKRRMSLWHPQGRGRKPGGAQAQRVAVGGNQGERGWARESPALIDALNTISYLINGIYGIYESRQVLAGA